MHHIAEHAARVAALTLLPAIHIWHKNRRLRDELDAAHAQLATDVNVLRGIASLAEFTAEGTTDSASTTPRAGQASGSGPAR